MRMGGQESSMTQGAPRTLHDIFYVFEGNNLDFLPDVDVANIGRISVVDAVEQEISEEYLSALQSIKERDIPKERDAVSFLLLAQDEIKKEKPNKNIILKARKDFQLVLDADI